MSEPNFCPSGAMFDWQGNPRLRFVRVKFDGDTMVIRAEDLPSHQPPHDYTPYEFEDVYLSEEEFKQSLNLMASDDTMSQNNELRAAAQAVLDRWNSPNWEWHKHGHTADLMDALYKALAEQAGQSDPVAIVAVAPGAQSIGWICGYVPTHNTKLYTHPAPVRQPLTDEEIYKGRELAGLDSTDDPMGAFRKGIKFCEEHHGITAQGDTQ